MLYSYDDESMDTEINTDPSTIIITTTTSNTLPMSTPTSVITTSSNTLPMSTPTSVTTSSNTLPTSTPTSVTTSYYYCEYC